MNGTERCSYAVDFINKKFDKFIIVSCDMPYLYPKTINFGKKFRENYIKKKNTKIKIHKKTKSKKDLNNKNIVKIAVTKNNNILYFSRAKIPSDYKKVSPEIFCTHHGIVMLDRYTLSKYKLLKTSLLQLSEDNEWIKFLENDFKIKSYKFNKIAPEINTLKDIKKLTKFYK